MPRIEVMPADELPLGEVGPEPPKAQRGPDGRFLPGGSKEVGAKGGKRKAEATKLRRLLGLTEVDEAHPYQPYHRLAAEWRDSHMADLAAHVGGGVIGPGVASIVSTAALQLGASRWMSDRGAASGDAKLLLDASRLADASRQNLLAAHELAAREAQARAKDRGGDTPWMLPAGSKDGAK